MKRFLVAVTVMWFNADGSEEAVETRYHVEYGTTPAVAARRTMIKVADADKAYSRNNPDSISRCSILLFVEALSERKINILYQEYRLADIRYNHYKILIRDFDRDYLVEERDIYGALATTLGKILDAIDAA